MRKLVYLPILPGRAMLTCSRVPAGRKRSKGRSRAGADRSESVGTGHPEPMQRTLIRAERGARTDSSVMRDPVAAK
jgi:hypothetical protein